MTIWLLALVLMASLAALGLRQGVIRVAFSFFGIMVGALLALPLGRLIRPLFGMMGLKDPLLLMAIPPLIAFLAVSIIFKIAALTVHQKVDVYYKYQAGDLRLALWERVHHRLGLCLGLFNGALYTILICWVIYVMSYWTVQTSSESDPFQIRMMNRLGQDLQSTGFAKVARAIDPVPATVYEVADVAGLLYNNPLLEARLSRYPAFLGLAELPEFQSLASDKGFSEMRQRRDPIVSVLAHPGVKAILENRDLMTTIHNTLVPNLNDLKTFLETGQSEKFSEPILGRWLFDLNYTVSLLRRLKTNISLSDMPRVKRALMAAYSKTAFVATAENKAVLKDAPKGAPIGAASIELVTLQGTWKGAEGKYSVGLSGKGELSASVEGDRLMLTGEGLDVALVRED